MGKPRMLSLLADSVNAPCRMKFPASWLGNGGSTQSSHFSAPVRLHDPAVHHCACHKKIVVFQLCGRVASAIRIADLLVTAIINRPHVDINSHAVLATADDDALDWANVAIVAAPSHRDVLERRHQ